jgi:murein DD-endopeptidase MepM/ murein hydrolase activator NlpD
MRQRTWLHSFLRVLGHDLTLAALVGLLLSLSASALLAARQDADALVPNGLPGADAPPALEEDLAPAEGPADLSAALSLPIESRFRVVQGKLEAGKSLAAQLAEQGIGAALIDRIQDELAPHFDFRRAQPGQSYKLVLDSSGSLIEFRFRRSQVESYVVRPDVEGWWAGRADEPLEARVVQMAGLVTTNLHDAFVGLGESGQLANDFAEIFAWDVDFSRNTHPGDEFRLIYERLYRNDDEKGEVYVRPGRILAARYHGAAGDFSAFYFATSAGHGAYYRPDGSSVERQFLQAPLSYSRISSRFSMARLHPILGVTRPHEGIDYAAPIGTPIWAVADGKVIYQGWGGGFGNLIKIRHRSGYVSYYAHLSAFAQGLGVGKEVQQKQVIGYVGSTGLSTGPHLHYEVGIGTNVVDPKQFLSIRSPLIESK